MSILNLLSFVQPRPSFSTYQAKCRNQSGLAMGLLTGKFTADSRLPAGRPARAAPRLDAALRWRQAEPRLARENSMPYARSCAVRADRSRRARSPGSGRAVTAPFRSRVSRPWRRSRTTPAPRAYGPLTAEQMTEIET